MTHPLNFKSEISQTHSNDLNSTKYPTSVPRGLSGTSAVTSVALKKLSSQLTGHKRKEIEFESSGNPIKRTLTMASAALPRPLFAGTLPLSKEASRKEETAAPPKTGEPQEGVTQGALLTTHPGSKPASEELQRSSEQPRRPDPSKGMLSSAQHQGTGCAVSKASIKPVLPTDTTLFETLPRAAVALPKEPSIGETVVSPKPKLIESPAGMTQAALLTTVPRSQLPSAEVQRLLGQACRADPSKGVIPEQLTVAAKVLYEPAGIKVTSRLSRETESAEYGACRFSLNGHTIVFRVAKTTPTKIGQFVTLWKRPSSATQPLDSKDKIDFVVISVLNGGQLGQLIFDKETLIKNKILSHGAEKGKLGFRIYSPSDQPTVSEAIRTKNWQSKYFFSLASSTLTDPARAHALFERIRALFKPAP